MFSHNCSSQETKLCELYLRHRKKNSAPTH